MDWIKKALASFATWRTEHKIAAAAVAVSAAGVAVTLIIAIVSGLNGLFVGKGVPVSAEQPAQVQIVTAPTGAGASVQQAGRDAIGTQNNFYGSVTYQISQEKSVPLSVLQTVLASMGEEAQGFNPEKVEELLRLKADEYNKLKAQLVGFKESDAGIQQLRKEVAAAMDKAQFDKARAILLEIRKHDEKALAQRLYSNAETSITLAGIEKLNVTPAGYRAAAGYYAEAAGIIGAIDPAQARKHRRQQASTLDDLGRVFGDQGALLEAIEIYRGVLREISKENEAEEWATTQNNLGVVLQVLASHEGNQHTLQEAVAAYRAALEIYTRDQAPIDWAKTQNNLGNARQKTVRLHRRPHGHPPARAGTRPSARSRAPPALRLAGRARGRAGQKRAGRAAALELSRPPAPRHRPGTGAGHGHSGGRCRRATRARHAATAARTGGL
ncbi:hypothetical protein FACS189488_07620 [Betaproteobacteria bacterium]|nr:hypothetical protein FACS189488_07620 [Betaproteobacteria bacterium]